MTGLIRAVVGGLVIGAALLAALAAGPVRDAFAVTCTTQPYAVVDATVSRTSDHRGVASTLLVVSNPSTTCIHVSSILVVAPNGDDVEFGWSKDNAANVYDCRGTEHDGNPYVFRDDIKNGSERCFQGPDVPGDRHRIPPVVLAERWI